MRCAIQLYTLRSLDEPLAATVERVGATAFDGVEFAGLGPESPETVAAALDDADLAAAAAHVPMDALESDLDATVETYRAVDCDHLVVPWLDPEHFESRETVEETATRLGSVADALAERGVGFSYHNHDGEFQSVDGRPALEALADQAPASVGLELDVGWALAGGSDPTALLDRYADRVTLVHLKNVTVADGRSVELGDGDVDVEGCAGAANEAGVAWFCYEHDEPDDPLASLDHGARTLAGLV